MKIIQLNSHDVYFNLAAEEYIFTQRKVLDTHVLIWQNKKAIVIGKHQNTIEEVNHDFVLRKDIQVARRLSGGGAVYHDLGNLNYSFIVHSEKMHWDIKRMADPVVEALRRLRVNVELNKRNDLLIGGKKISGSSQYIKHDRLLHHGTLLFNSDLNALSKSLIPGVDHIESKSIKSVRSHVTNICDHYPKISISGFIAVFIDVLSQDSDVEAVEFSAQDLNEISKLRNEKYNSWEWTYARSPEYRLTKQRIVNDHMLNIAMGIKDGSIQSLQLDIDIMGEEELAEVERSLIGAKLREDDVTKALEKVDPRHYFSGLSTQDLVYALIN